MRMYDDEKQRAYLREQFRQYRTLAWRDARNEFISRIKEGDKISLGLVCGPQSLYDKTQRIQREPTMKFDYIWQGVVSEVFGKPHVAVIQRAIGGVALLRRSGYSNDEVIAIMGDKPLEQWHQTARRISKLHSGRRSLRTRAKPS
jgi:hypothetical protein